MADDRHAISCVALFNFSSESHLTRNADLNGQSFVLKPKDNDGIPQAQMAKF